jgi:hypothetical protein
MAGADALPARWLGELELRDLVTTLATELASAVTGGTVDKTRYPGEAGALVGVSAVR